MKELTQDEKKKIVDALSKRGANQPCPRCNKKEFSLLGGYLNQPIQQKISGTLSIGGPSLPSVAVICNNCGYISQHALGVLGLMPQRDEGKKDAGK